MKFITTEAGKPLGFGNLVDELLNHPVARWFDDEAVKAGFAGAFPPVNIRESKDTFYVDVVAPGFEKGDFKINVEGDTLHLTAEQKEEKKEESDKQVRKEYHFRSFKRAFTLSDAVDTEKINASYENGVLQVQLPKKAEKVPQNKEISIR